MRTRRLLVLIVAAMASMTLITPAAASAATEYGSTNKWPWSGYWWPMLENNYNLYSDNGPLQKYDTQFGTGAKAWERQNHYTNDAANKWWGHCHAWASAAILAPEPKATGNYTINDTKGLTTALYYEPTFQWLSGVRVDDVNDRSSAAYQDIAPAWMDYLLRYYVQEHGSSFVMDTDPGSPVWNFPVAGFERSTSKNGDGSVRVKTDVWFRKPTAGVAGYDPNSFFRKTYEYDLWNTADGRGSTGRWVSDDRPDFAWASDGHKATDGQTQRNPKLDPKIVEEILGYAI